jgi:acetyl-CoA carboxylase carboxyltransferase component
LRERERRARYERPQRDLDRLARQRKMFVRDRIEMLIDLGTPFLTLSITGGEPDVRGRSAASRADRPA